MLRTALLVLFCTLPVLSCSDLSDLHPLARQSEITRDTFGIPHIEAETVRAAGFAFGYATAEDYYSFLMRMLCRTRGEASMYFGANYVESDFAVKHFQLLERAREQYDALSGPVKEMTDGYAAGLNHYASLYPEKREQFSFEVTPADILAHGLYIIQMNFVYGISNYSNAVRRHPDFGSNMWAIGPYRSESGNPLLLANPHLPWNDIVTWYEAHIHVPDTINVYGATFPGMPVITIGHNRTIAWSHTVNNPDLVDTYELTLAGNGRESYLYEGKQRPLTYTVDSVGVPVMTGGIKWEKRRLYRSHYGPVTGFNGNHGYAVKVIPMDAGRAYSQWFAMGRAGNIGEFRQALALQGVPMFNTCYAGADGNIFYLYGGTVPDRNREYNWSGVVPGNISDTEWRGFLSNDDLPQLFNPATGYVQNSNGAPWYTNASTRIYESFFPGYIGNEGLDFRGQQAVKLLERDRSISLKELKTYKWDTHVLLADRVKNDLLTFVKNSALYEKEDILVQAVGVLDEWDNTFARESVGGDLFVSWWRLYRRSTKNHFKTKFNGDRPFDTPAGIGDPDAAVISLLNACSDLNQRYGTLSVRWGDTHRIFRGEREVPVGGAPGSYGVFRVIEYTMRNDYINMANGGDSFVLTVELSDPPVAYTILPHGNSRNPDSPHFDDQMALFAGESYKRAWFTEDDIQNNAERRYRPGQGKK